MFEVDEATDTRMTFIMLDTSPCISDYRGTNQKYWVNFYSFLIYVILAYFYLFKGSLFNDLSYVFIGIF